MASKAKQTAAQIAAKNMAAYKGSAVEGIGGRAVSAPVGSGTAASGKAAQAATTSYANPVTTTTTTPATNPIVQPYLNPAQQNALDNLVLKYGEDISNLNLADTNALSTMQAGVAADTLKNSESVDTTNQAMGARGMFQSSIRDGALNDLAATLSTQTNLLNTNYQTTLLKNQGTIGLDTSLEGSAQSYYGGLAANNAQAITPTLPTPATTATTTSQPANTSPPPVPTSVTNQPQSSSKAPSGANAAMASAAGAKLAMTQAGAG